MFSKKKKQHIDPDQYELIKNAESRIRQKKRLYYHFMLFLLGSAFMIIANKGLKQWEEYDWFLWAILGWSFFFLIHLINVFVTTKFMGKTWKEQQLQKLVKKQQDFIDKKKAELQKEANLIAESEFRKEQQDRKTIAPTTTQQISTKQTVTMIAAAGQNNELGKDNDLVWHLPVDFKRFKNLTTGHHIIMGRKTWESFPKPLPKRTHIVITRKDNYDVPEGVIVVNSLEQALALTKGDPNPYIIGGGEIYNLSIPYAEKLELTRVYGTFEADTYFPEVDMTIWKEVARASHGIDEKHAYAFDFITYEKI